MNKVVSYHKVGTFGGFGGSYVPELLVEPLKKLWEAYLAAKADPVFVEELQRLRIDYIGGPTPIYHAKQLSKLCGGAKIYLKREDLAFTGSHKINNAIGQALLASRLGIKRIITTCCSGSHGIAAAAACKKFALDCTIYMGTKDLEHRAKLQVKLMKTLGATVAPVDGNCASAIDEAMRDLVAHVGSTYYMVASATGPHPFPTMVRDFQSVIGIEAREQLLSKLDCLPNAVVACVGGGSNAIGIFTPFIDDEEVRLVGVEGGGEGANSAGGAATLTCGAPGVLHGARTYLLHDSTGQLREAHSIGAGLEYPGVNPQLSFLYDTTRVTCEVVTDEDALKAYNALVSSEGICPALEAAHAVHHAMKLAREMGPSETVLVNLCGSGDKDTELAEAANDTQHLER